MPSIMLRDIPVDVVARVRVFARSRGLSLVDGAVELLEEGLERRASQAAGGGAAGFGSGRFWPFTMSMKSTAEYTRIRVSCDVSPNASSERAGAPSTFTISQFHSSGRSIPVRPCAAAAADSSVVGGYRGGGIGAKSLELN